MDREEHKVAREVEAEIAVIPCEYVIKLGSLVYGEPPEYCEEDSAPGEIYCPRHLAQIEGEWNG